MAVIGPVLSKNVTSKLQNGFKVPQGKFTCQSKNACFWVWQENLENQTHG